MCIRIMLLLALLAMSGLGWAEDKLPSLQAGTNHYSNVTVTKVSATDVYFISDQGMANVKLKDLDPVLQGHFNYDAAKAATTEKKQKAGNALYHFRVLSETNHPTSIAEFKAEMEDAVARVSAIVNQPVTRLPRTPDMEVSTYSPGWFHDGAVMPDFNTVDIRTTQQTDYVRNHYVTSDLNPGVVFIGSELEFNPMTKFFYVDRSLPKKKLTGPEMVEINRLYRIIGQDKAAINKLQAQ